MLKNVCARHWTNNQFKSNPLRDRIKNHIEFIEIKSNHERILPNIIEYPFSSGVCAGIPRVQSNSKNIENKI